MQVKNWFDVDREGLKSLQDGKPKSWIARELIQNAWDENISFCKVEIHQKNSFCFLSVEDDNPDGFKDLTCAFTLFKNTDKRKNPNQRGRFNLGEKQAFSRCTRATIQTTKGTIVFDNIGRSTKRAVRDHGSKVEAQFKCSREECDKIIAEIKSYLPPSNFKFLINDEKISSQLPVDKFNTALVTELEENGIFKRTLRKTDVYLYKSTKPFIYEMGIPVQEIPESKYSIDVQQKIPLGVDRETVLPSFLRDLYAEVLNQTFNEVKEEESSQVWIRQAFTSKRIEKVAVKEIVESRYGDKVVIANPRDPIANDDAIANGYRVIRGAELSKEEWNTIKEVGDNCIKSSTKLFGKTPTNNYDIISEDKLTAGHKYFRKISQKIAKEFLNVTLSMSFIKSKENLPAASYGKWSQGNRCMTVNLSKLKNDFFKEKITTQMLDLIIHEICHEKGMHTEESYHRAITKLGAELTLRAIEDSKWFN